MVSMPGSIFNWPCTPTAVIRGPCSSSIGLSTTGPPLPSISLPPSTARRFPVGGFLGHGASGFHHASCIVIEFLSVSIEYAMRSAYYQALRCLQLTRDHLLYAK